MKISDNSPIWKQSLNPFFVKVNHSPKNNSLSSSIFLLHLSNERDVTVELHL